MAATFTRKRIEILVDTPLAPLIVEAAAEAGIAGYTLIPVQSGAGRSGSWRDDRVTGVGTKSIFLTVASEEKASALVDLLRPNLDEYGLLLTMSDVAVVRSERFK